MSISDEKMVIRRLKSGEISVFQVPRSFQNHPEIVKFERENGMRATGKRGFDVISNVFFAEEELIKHLKNDKLKTELLYFTFEDFDSYYEFLSGDIYNDSCYKFCPISKISNSKYDADIDKMMSQKAFEIKTVDDFTLLHQEENETEEYEQAEQIHEFCVEWLEKIKVCHNYQELIKCFNKFHSSQIKKYGYSHYYFFQRFFLFNYIYIDLDDIERFNAAMEYISCYCCAREAIAICTIYNPNDVLNTYDCSYGAKSTNQKQKGYLRKYVNKLLDGKIRFEKNAYFDEITHFYCETVSGYEDGNSAYVSRNYRYFATFDEFITYRKGDLTNCDLSNVRENIDFSKYKIDASTKLPINQYSEIQYSINKYYKNGKFFVVQSWKNRFGEVVKKYENEFKYFFDFAAFLNDDLSCADLLLCEGLANAENFDGIDFTDALLTSDIKEKFGVPYEPFIINSNSVVSLENTVDNEGSLQMVSADNPLIDNVDRGEYLRVSYISDIHLMHKLINSKCRSKEDVIYIIRNIVKSIKYEVRDVLLIDGDVSSDFEIFKLFVAELSKDIGGRILIVFTLGNHEYWSFRGKTVREIEEIYRNLLNEHGMYLLCNDIILRRDYSYYDPADTHTEIMKYSDLCGMDDSQIASHLKDARFVILGGTGFSGYNVDFNADDGVYGETLSRDEEVKETLKFEAIYNRLYPILKRRNSIVLTHTPKKDWCSDPNPQSDVVYISGHTHRNYYYDDGEYRVYSDNQIGYKNNSPHLKNILLNKKYDIFDDLPEGIHEITKEQYIDFCRGKNMPIEYNRAVHKLYVVKKQGCYCFIHQSEKGSLTILNGGQLKTLEFKDIQYYYDNMDIMIRQIRNPLEKFTAYQQKVSDAIKKFGGEGRIHGCIVDIDFYNHIYVNPDDLSLIPYSARDIIDKTVYPSISNLLELECPSMYKKYVKLLAKSPENALVVNNNSAIIQKPQKYYDTDIYAKSREIYKMQKLKDNILSFWNEDVIKKENSKLLN